MSPAQVANLLHRLPSKKRKSPATLQARRPWRTRTKCKLILKTAAERAHLQNARLERKEALNQALSEAREMILEQARVMRKCFGSHKIDYYFRLIMQRPHKSVYKRQVNPWNAWQRGEVKRHNDTLPPGEPQRKTDYWAPILKEEWALLAKEECAMAAAPYIEELQAECEMKKCSVHDMEQAAFNDAHGSLASIQHELMALSERTGMQMILFTVCSTPESYGSLHVFYTDDRLSDFIEFTTKNWVADFSARMDGYVLSGVDGAVTNYNQETTRMKSRLAALIKQKLKEGSPRPVGRLTYINFETNITIPY
ncbi:uncharacterized protein LAESUDRAFT_757077 [Laetiporus sulphureus 93-53]|uniref:Uncharacterized protein n=1 Tax=Laetiporus sulphureus 93-53 TaxID=1314785 RepID=A0A165FFL0_9APHY|nr:uncharacterized protein LAESUDRAFT_757077 [Laetiporus sulphureus 93-53]KZT08897.1 hypothetical protein LAESUDRAFT_757077 [Laetiporus sulphureus 93-53]